MNLKSRLMLLSVLLVMSISVWTLSCDVSDNETPLKFDCNKVCTKEKECYSWWKEQDLNDCIKDCNLKNDSGYVQNSYIKAASECYDKTCSELQMCLVNSLKQCKTPDYMTFVNAACEKAISCGSDSSKEDCVNAGKSDIGDDMNKDYIIRCLTDRAYTDLANCIRNANCETAQDDYMKCDESIMRFKFLTLP